MKTHEPYSTAAVQAAQPDDPSPTLRVEELRECTRVLEAIVADRANLSLLDAEGRARLYEAAGRVIQPDRDARARLLKAERKQQQREEHERRQKDRRVVASTRIRELRRAPVFVAPPLLPSGVPDAAAAGPEELLENPRKCYVCKAEYRKLHFFYDALCQACGELNYAKRFQTGRLDGKVALLTGGRVKIGYQASLMLLRAGAKVIVTTRFPNDAALRYAREEDFQAWGHRLQIHGLDLRHAPSVELFARHLEATLDRLDILINNAAQTVRRPPGFYAHLSEVESLAAGELPPEARRLLEGHHRCVAALSQTAQLGDGGGGAGGSASPGLVAPGTTSWRSTDPTLGIRASAALSQIPYGMEQEGDVEALFPRGKLDADLQQVDLRNMNSWRLRLADVATAEMLEVHLVNAVAPFILCGKLKPLMLRDRREPGHIVNVSAMEGVFSRGTKTDKHPHTNMAKAALNMMTLTSAQDYARDKIYMNAADTGWVTDEDPVLLAERKVEELDFQPPLDIVDGAARIVDPVFTAIRTGEYVWGNFFKDYKSAPW